MNLHFLGGAMEIGGSCIYIRIAGKGILLDSGIRQSASKDPIPDFRTVQEQGGVDAIIISHAHMDHIGTLPMISKAYPRAQIYMTAMTEDLTRVLLYDSLKIMKNREDEIPHYSEQDVLAMLERIHPIGYQMPFPILDGFTLTFYPAGHIAGAACIYLVTEEGSLFYSGDFSAFSQRTIEGIRIPKLRPDVSVVETTYGNRLHANRMVEEKRLVELVGECIAQKKKILIPTFALGRAQEVLLILRTAFLNQEIPSVPVFVDGMVRDINRMYVRNPIYLKNALGKRILKGNEPFYTKEIAPVAPTQKREELLAGNEPVILVSSSGMLTGGPSAQYAKLLASSEDACIIITGYQDEESPGRQLLDLLHDPEGGKLTVNGSTVPVKCRIEQVGLSAHGDKSEIMALLERLSSRRVFLVHGTGKRLTSWEVNWRLRITGGRFICLSAGRRMRWRCARNVSRRSFSWSIPCRWTGILRKRMRKLCGISGGSIISGRRSRYPRLHRSGMEGRGRHRKEFLKRCRIFFFKANILHPMHAGCSCLRRIRRKPSQRRIRLRS